MAAPNRRVSRLTLFFLFLSVLLGVLLYLEKRPREPERQPDSKAARRVPTPRKPARRARTRPAPAAEAAARVAIVIDDLGNDAEAVRRISRFSQPVAGAVLPGLPGSAPAARTLSGAGQEVMLHLPMEPHGFPQVRPGPGVVVRGQTEKEIAAIFSRDLASVPGAVGVNNHMGSAATEDPRVMRAVLREIADRGLFFLDSRTSDATVAAELARELGVPAASRQVFLDRVATETAVRSALEALVQRARREGSAVAVAHPYAVTLAVLEEELPKLAGRGVKVVRVSELVRR